MKNLFCSAILIIAASAYGQKKDCTQTEKELAKVKSENIDLAKQNNYYKETLDLLHPLVTVSADNLKFDIIKATASKTQKSLKIYYIYRNTSTNTRKFFQPSQAYMVDPQGNQSSTYEVFASEDKVRVDNIEPNIPMKGKLVFKISETGFPELKLLNLKFSNTDSIKDGLESTLIFKNIPVHWID